jgi:hypothetical protein
MISDKIGFFAGYILSASFSLFVAIWCLKDGQYTDAVVVFALSLVVFSITTWQFAKMYRELKEEEIEESKKPLTIYKYIDPSEVSKEIIRASYAICKRAKKKIFLELKKNEEIDRRFIDVVMQAQFDAWREEILVENIPKEEKDEYIQKYFFGSCEEGGESDES